jgi:hypothetical protein
LSPSSKRFAIALSFPGEHRKFVRNVAFALAPELGKDRIFFDEWHESELHGSEADLKLKAIYKEQATLVVPFFSAHYKKMWCQIEWHAIRALLAERRKDDAVVPVLMDSTPIEGWESIDLGIRKRSKDSARVIAAKIVQAYRHRAESKEQSSSAEVVPHPRADSDLHQHNIKIGIAPTRDQRGQLAQIRVFNVGPRPFYVSAWFVAWSPLESIYSSQCVRGQLPARLKDQEALDLLVDISQHPVSSLTAIGVLDGENKSRTADNAQLQGFIHTAELYATRQLSVHDFVGHWRMADENGQPPFLLTLAKSGKSLTARKSHEPGATGTWVVYQGEARIEWSDEWSDILRPQNGGMLKIAFRPGTSWGDAPDNTQRATREASV